tara:strand:- start:3032 stop:3430 length:399 start_codon:yes stop_codon:yes gene_type:complete
MSEDFNIFQDNKNFLGYPFKSSDPDLSTTDNIVEQTKYRLMLLFSVVPGERLGNITYGGPMWKYIFTQAGYPAEELAMKSDLSRSIKKWLPDITIKNISVTSNPDSNHQTKISVEFSLPRFDNLEATFNMAV